ncbi:uncharacterized protein ISCGN_016252 [Ixodes scapularis]
MSFPGLAPPPPFLQTPGRPSLPWEEWEQTFTVYLLASGAAECPPERRKAILLHCLGAEGQRVFRTLPAGSSAAAPAVQDKPTAATTDVYASALAALRKQFSTSCNVVVERHRFHRRNQHAGESVHDFVAALRQLVSHCSFNSQDEALRDQFVAGVASNRGSTREYRKGSTNTVADALSRLPAPTSEAELSKEEENVSLVEPASMTKEEFKQAALNDDCLQTVKSFVRGSWPPQKSVPEEAKPFYSVREELSIVDDLLLRAERLVVPSSLTAQFIAVAHETHLGITRTKARLRELFWWPRMDKQVESAMKNCHICLEADKFTSRGRSLYRKPRAPLFAFHFSPIVQCLEELQLPPKTEALIPVRIAACGAYLVEP